MKIKAIRHWNPTTVQNLCIKEDWYIFGDNSEFDAMLEIVRTKKPTTTNLYKVAKDIADHSEYQTITNIMYVIENNAIRTSYEIDGSDEI